MKKSPDTTSDTLGLQMLTIAFIVLKLVGVITWSWVWVLSPIWIPIVVVLFILLVFLAARAIAKR